MKPSPIIIAVLAIGMAVGSVFGFRAWRDYREKKAPIDLSQVDTQEAFDFIATDEFAAWPDWKRQKYAVAAIDKLGEKTLQELVAMMMTPDKSDRRKKISENFRKLPNPEEIGNHWGDMFFNKFYTQPAANRTAMLTMIAMAQQGDVGQHPERFGLPDPEKLKREMTKFVMRTPRSQAMFAQFMVDLQHQRDVLGLKDPAQVAKERPVLRQ